MSVVHLADLECDNRISSEDTNTAYGYEVTCPSCIRTFKKRVAVFEPSRTIPHDGLVVADDDVEFKALIRCVNELNRLNALDKKAAMRVADYLFNRYNGK